MSITDAKLESLYEELGMYVERGEVSGMVTLISQGDDIYVNAIGTKEIDNDEVISQDTIFRLTSLTKPITAAIVMILVEEGKLQLDEPIDCLLPELANRRVLKRLDGPLDDTEQAKRSITVRDLLSFQMGFGIIMESSNSYPIQEAVRQQKIMTLGPPTPPIPHTPDEWIRRFGALPLMHQPGEKWMYNTGSYVLGVLISRAANQPLESFMQERLFGKLGMKDTGFHVPTEKIERLATCYQYNRDLKSLTIFDGVKDSQWSQPPVFPDAGAGLVSTIGDYLAFTKMLMNKGMHGTERILSTHSVELMTTDQLTPQQKEISHFFPGFWENRGWGLGLSMINKSNASGSEMERYGWDGGYGTSWYSAPKEDLIAIIMTQRMNFPVDSQFILDRLVE